MHIIKLQQRRIVSLASAGVETQLEPEAADVSRFRFVTPFIRLLRDPGNSLTTSAPITFSFLTAALLESANDSNEWGTRFIDTGISIVTSSVTALSGASSNGYTIAPTATNGVFNAIQSQGGLLIWRATNGTGSVSTVAFEIDLVCREG